MPKTPYLIVVGGSYVGVNTAQQLAAAFHNQYRVLLIEANSHFQHLFAFPRFAVTTSVDTHKAFIPYVPGAFASSPPGSGTVVQARVTAISASGVELDRSVSLDGSIIDNIPYSFLVLATGTRLTAPSSLPGSAKLDGVTFLREHARQVQQSSTIVIIGGGAVGVQMATDIKELYPEKSVTLVHSRKTIMHKFHPKLHEIIKNRCDELGISLKLGSRVKVPSQGYPTDGTPFKVELEDGTNLPADFAIICTGQTPQSEFLRSFTPESIGKDGFIRTARTLQIIDSKHQNIFAVGDVAATGAHKAARPGGAQAALVVKNIQHLLNNETLGQYDTSDPPGIHLTLGVTQNVIFRNPASGSSDPVVKHQNDGRLDMNIDGVWTRRGGGADASL